jgi:DNA-binding response OmpR family regulator
VNLLRPEALVDMTSSTSPTVLIVEDHIATRRFLADNLSADGFTVLEAATLADAHRLIAGGAPSLIVLDLGLPDGDGLDLLSVLRDGSPDGPGAAGSGLPVLVLSGRADEVDRVRGLERGADDFLAKPFGYLELRARIHALLRRATRAPRAQPIRVATLELDPAAHEVRVEGRAVHLSRKEFALARMLASAPTRTFGREELLREVWGYRSPGRTRTLDTHAHRLRRKLSAGRVAFVVNVWGVGYRLCDEVVAG